MNIEKILTSSIIEAVREIYGHQISEKEVQLQQTRKDISGDLTLVIFPLLRMSKKSPELTAIEIGEYLKKNINLIAETEVIKGFLNLTIKAEYWLEILNSNFRNKEYGHTKLRENPQVIVIEYSSPNTNKPLHLGHIRNNLLGNSIAEILKANGHQVIKVNLVNDRGIHICKSMLAYQKFGNNETPEQSNKKGDKLVGDYYVKFDVEYRKQIEELKQNGSSEEQAKKQALLILEAQDMLRKWETKDTEVIELWTKMNNWVYQGFDITYQNMGISFDKVYHESETYLLGKEMVAKGVESGVLYQKEDKTICINLTADGLDEKVLLRSDGTSVYITQDMGTANSRFEDYQFNKQIYVVGNEQDYHFKVLFKILEKLGKPWAKNLFHLSYGMVELPEGKMKSREGKVVDADDLMEEMIETSKEMSLELGKLEGFEEEEKNTIYQKIGLGALKYFILKVDPKKNMMFNPKESIDFNGNTGPFVQYTYTRIRSVLRKATENNITIPESVSQNIEPDKKELSVIKMLNNFPAVVKEAGDSLSPAIVVNYIYEVAKEYNQFYHDFQIIREENTEIRGFRLMVSVLTATVLKNGLSLLGIEVPERM